MSNTVTWLSCLMFAALPVSAEALEIYKCQDANGRPLYTSDKGDAVGRQCELLSRAGKPSARSSPGAPTSAADIDKLATYAVVLGRGGACGADTQDASRRVGRWMDSTFPAGSADQKTYLPIFADGVHYQAQQQKFGKNPVGCPAVLRSFSGFTWPGG